MQKEGIVMKKMFVPVMLISMSILLGCSLVNIPFMNTPTPTSSPTPTIKSTLSPTFTSTPTLIPTSTPTLQPSETFYLDTRNISAVSNLILNYGRPYRITMTGTYSYYEANHWEIIGLCNGESEPEPLIASPGVTNGQVGADPEYRFAHPKGSGGCINGELLNPDDRISWIVFSLKDGKDGGDLFNPDPINNGYRNDHTYEYSILGLGFPLTVELFDDPYDDNYGQIKITIDPQ
jgi:hypothetical protein